MGQDFLDIPQKGSGAKKNMTSCRSYLACRENEKVQDQMLDCKLGRGRQLSDKVNHGWLLIKMVAQNTVRTHVADIFELRHI